MHYEKKILIIDDDRDLSDLVKVLLQSKGYGVERSFTATEGLEKVKELPNLILLDRDLPDIEGLEVCRMVRADKRFRMIPIIMLTGRDKSTEKIEGLYIGADDYITKPFDSEELLARIEVAIRRSNLHEDNKDDKDSMIMELNKILKNEMITPFFQPIYSIETHEPIGFEALSRPPTTAILNNPEVFFKAAFTFGVYSEIETMCWRKALTKWNESQHKGRLFLNCTPYFIESREFDQAFLEKIGIDPNIIVLEITERMAIQNYSGFLEKLNNLKRLGVRIAVDDVGSGFASLDTVAEVRPDFVKIDMSLVRRINTDMLKQNIVESIIMFCKKSNIKTIAEGIESSAELATVKKLGVDAVQGYLLCRPNQEINVHPYAENL